MRRKMAARRKRIIKGGEIEKSKEAERKEMGSLGETAN